MGAIAFAIKGVRAMARAEITVRDLGELRGEVLLFGGPYSNLQASRALLAQAEALQIPPERRICTGDVVAYCADPVATLALWRGRGLEPGRRHEQAQIVAGNCEKQLAVAASDCGCGFEADSACDLLSRGWYPYADAAMDAGARAFMAGLPDVIVFGHAGRRYAVIHGGLHDVARFLWPVSDAAALQEEITAIQALVGHVDAVIAGHSGIAFQRRIGAVDWINAGVIGMPGHDGNAQTVYAVLGADGVRFARLDYDATGAQAAMQAAGLVQGYERALTTGHWPSEDVLPAQMRLHGTAATAPEQA
jgi:predicted phosphodiesterase